MKGLETINLFIQSLVAFGTFFSCIIAIWGEKIKSKLFSPKLVLELENPKGEITKDFETETRKIIGPSRYYHIKVSNTVKYPKATKVNVCIIKVARKGPDGNYLTVWAGETPLEWKNSSLYGLYRDIGHPALCDLCSIHKNNTLHFCFQTVINPNNMPKILIDPFNYQITLQAISAEAVSEKMILNISWDGKWEDGENEMQKHFIIKEV